MDILHGLALMRDASMRQRAQRMIEVAHPHDRDVLTAQARGLGLL